MQNIITKQVQEQIESALFSVESDLFTHCKASKNGTYWETMGMDADQKVIWNTSETIYSGNSGIALFYLALYEYTKDKKYLDIAISTVKWVEYFCEHTSAHSYALFTGRMGVGYTYTALYKHTQDKKYIDKALDIAAHCDELIENTGGIDDLINGSAGILLGLLLLHSSTQNPELPEKINRFACHLINALNVAKKGLYWDRSHHHINGLCGLSHGAAGIGYAFLMLGHYLQNPAFYELARQAFDYEKPHYNRKENNWADLRKGAYGAEELAKSIAYFEKGDYAYFKKAAYMNAWCHGAAGIGLSRLSAYALIKDPRYKSEWQHAVKKTRATDIEAIVPRRSYTLCHGAGGNADIFLEAYRHTGKAGYLRWAQQVALGAIQSHDENKIYYSGYSMAGAQEDLSLFMGNAGVGYFYLRVLDPLNIKSILAPAISNAGHFTKEQRKTQVVFDYEKRDIISAIIKKIYPNTLLWLSSHHREKLKEHFSNEYAKDESKAYAVFEKFMIKELRGMAVKGRRSVGDIFRQERTKFKMDLFAESHALLYIKTVVTQKNKADTAYLNKLIKLDNTVKLVKFNYTLEDNKPFIPKKERGNIALKRTAYGVEEKMLSSFSNLVLNQFTKPQTFLNAKAGILAHFDELNTDEIKKVEDAFEEQTKNALISGILCVTG